MNDMIENERFSPGMQLAILLMAFGIGYILGGIVTFLVAAAYLHQPLQALAANPKLIEENAPIARILQVVGTLSMFGLPAFVFAYITRKEKALAALGFTRAISIKQVFYTLLIVLAALWVSEGFTLVNQWIPIPAGNAFYFKQLEDEYTKQAITLLDLKDISGYLTSLFIIALLPAILEELIFRACLVKEHLVRAIEWKGEVLGILEMRSHYTNYLKGFPNIKEFRNRLVVANTFEAIAEILDEATGYYNGFVLHHQPFAFKKEQVEECAY